MFQAGKDSDQFPKFKSQCSFHFTLYISIIYKVYKLVFILQDANRVTTSRVSFIPTAHTCSNTLELPRGLLTEKVASEEFLFNNYDYAFCNKYFGII